MSTKYFLLKSFANYLSYVVLFFKNMENANKLSSKKDNQTSCQEVVNTAFINNQLPQVETPTKLVLSKLPFIFFTLLVLVFLLVLAEIFPYKKMEDTKIQLKYIKIFPKPTLITQQPQQQKSKQWVLKKKINGGVSNDYFVLP